MSSNTFTLGTKSVNRLGYGAMQLAGPGVFGPPRDRHVAITVLREALLALGVRFVSIPATFMVRTSPIRLSAKRFISATLTT